MRRSYRNKNQHRHGIYFHRLLEVKKLLAEGFSSRPIKELVLLLGHADMRVRQEAQFALVAHGPAAIKAFEGVAEKSKNRLARLHAHEPPRQLRSGGARVGVRARQAPRQ